MASVRSGKTMAAIRRSSNVLDHMHSAVCKNITRRTFSNDKKSDVSTQAGEASWAHCGDGNVCGKCVGFGARLVGVLCEPLPCATSSASLIVGTNGSDSGCDRRALSHAVGDVSLASPTKGT
jgi:hypothetical protein